MNISSALQDPQRQADQKNNKKPGEMLAHSETIRYFLFFWLFYFSYIIFENLIEISV
jgi:hypothetical protein